MTTFKIVLILLLATNVVIGKNFWNRYHQRSVPQFRVDAELYSVLPNPSRLRGFELLGFPSVRPDEKYTARHNINREMEGSSNQGSGIVPYYVNLIPDYLCGKSSVS